MGAEPVRVISGSKRGTKLLFIENDSVRPTTDRVKEAVFNIIQFHVRDSSVLDLFAGCGGLGIEALSRGAKHAVFVDHGKETFSILHKNIEKTGFGGQADCRLSEFETYLRTAREPFDLIFLDPPYHKGLSECALKLIDERRLLNPGGLIVLECDGDEEIIIPDSFHQAKKVQYGRVKITILKIEE